MSDIRHSMRAIEDTEQITKAMHLISTSKMRKALNKNAANTMHFNRVQAAVKDILMHSREISHPFIGQSEGKRAAYVVIAADKGLAGGYNHNVLNYALRYMQKSKERYILTIGQEARAFFDKRGYMIDVEFLHMSQNPSLVNARSITNDILELYNNGLMDEVYVVYTHFISTFLQEPTVLKLLPLDLSNFIDVNTEISYDAEIAYHPSPEAVLDTLVPQYIIGLLYGCLVQAFASEQCARMLAMENATKNADEMIDTLQKEYNRARQYAITKEISEIIGAQEALS
jgi:F-type H+-transporting ATPase subunit gamma